MQPMILIQVACPLASRNRSPARHLLETICIANETQRAGKIIQMPMVAISGGVQLGGFLICKVIEIDLVSQIGHDARKGLEARVNRII